jgi:hypothetical protein
LESEELHIGFGGETEGEAPLGRLEIDGRMTL